MTDTSAIVEVTQADMALAIAIVASQPLEGEGQLRNLAKYLARHRLNTERPSTPAAPDAVREALKPFVELADCYDASETDNHECWLEAGPMVLFPEARKAFRLGAVRKVAALAPSLDASPADDMVEAAYREGYYDGGRDEGQSGQSYTADQSWELSEAKEALSRHAPPEALAADAATAQSDAVQEVLRDIRACRLDAETVQSVHGPIEAGPRWSVSTLTALLPRIDAALATPPAPVEMRHELCRLLEIELPKVHIDMDTMLASSPWVEELADRILALRTASSSPAALSETVEAAHRHDQGERAIESVSREASNATPVARLKPDWQNPAYFTPPPPEAGGEHE